MKRAKRMIVVSLPQQIYPMLNTSIISMTDIVQTIKNLSLSPKRMIPKKVVLSALKFTQKTTQFDFLNTKTYIDVNIKPKEEKEYDVIKSNGKGPVGVNLLHSNYENYEVKCNQISTEDCEKLCNQSNGILRIIENDPVCTFFKLAVSICFEVSFGLSQPTLIGGCFPDNSYAFYKPMVLNKKYDLNNIVGLLGCYGKG